jgi:SEC-C motif-containing protein
MRSRYSAFSKGDVKYLIKTHASQTQDKYLAKGLKETCDSCEFTRLDVLSSEDGLANQLSGYVSFVAWFKDKEGDNLALQQIAEKSYFERSSLEDNWLYIDGAALTPSKPSRNDSCPCNSGNKFKRCCA